MNCFEARKEFVSFWRRTMPEIQRVQFNTHLRECARCDRSFRIFALTAPALHSETEPETVEAAHRTAAPPHRPSVIRTPVRREPSSDTPWRAMTMALTMAAAAAIVVYLSIPARVTFEDALALENPAIDPVSYTVADNIFGQELFDQDLNVQQSVYDGPAANDSLE